MPSLDKELNCKCWINQLLISLENAITVKMSAIVNEIIFCAF